MSWWIKGILSKEDRKLLNYYPCWVYSSNPEEDEGGRVIKHDVDEVEYEHPSRDLGVAEDLWDLIGSEKGDELTRIIREEIRTEKNKVYDYIFEGEDVGFEEIEQYIINQESIRKMLSILERFEEPFLLDWTDKAYRVRPEKIDYVLQNAPDLVQIQQGENGTQVYSLSNTLAEAQGPEWFLRQALRLGRDIYWD